MSEQNHNEYNPTSGNDSAIPPPPQKEASGGFTFNRLLLVCILVLQVAILFTLYIMFTHNRHTAAEILSGDTTSGRPQGARSSDTPRWVSMSPHRLPAPDRDPFFDDLQRMHAMQEHMGQIMRRVSTDFGRVERMFDEGWGSIITSPAMDMRDLGDRYAVDFSLPGIESANIEVALQGRLLRVRTSSGGDEPNPQSFSEFERQVLMPGPVQSYSNAAAMLTNGILRVTIPKALDSCSQPGAGHIQIKRFPAPQNVRRPDTF